MDIKQQQLLILLLISKNKKHANTYDLSRILNRFFGIFDSSDALESIATNNYVSIEKTVYGVHYYDFTDLGIKTLKIHKDNLIGQLEKDFPERVDFINLLR